MTVTTEKNPTPRLALGLAEHGQGRALRFASLSVRSVGRKYHQTWPATVEYVDDKRLAPWLFDDSLFENLAQAAGRAFARGDTRIAARLMAEREARDIAKDFGFDLDIEKDRLVFATLR